MPVKRRVRRKVGRPRHPTSQASKDALWKRAQRSDSRPPDRGMVRHHLDGAYGRKNSKTRYVSRGEHNRIHGKMKVRRKGK